METVPAQMRTGPDWYKGSADAIYQNLNLITDEEPDHVFVFGADHVYRMDVRQMLDFHVEQKADCTVAAIPVPIEQGREFGIIDVGPDGRDAGFLEKPKNPPPMPGNPKMCLASMGNYLFTHRGAGAGDRPRRRPTRARPRLRQVDHHRDVQARAGLRLRLRPERACRARARRSAATGATWGTSTSTTSPTWTWWTWTPSSTSTTTAGPSTPHADNCPPAKFVFADAEHDRVGNATDSLVSEGCIISGGRVHRSVLSPKVRVNSLLRGRATASSSRTCNIGRHCQIRRAIIDKNVDIPPGTTIGYDPEEDRRRFHVTPGGVVVIPKGMKVA